MSENIAETVTKLNEKAFNSELKDIKREHTEEVNKLTKSINSISKELEDYKKNNVIFESVVYDFVDVDSFSKRLEDAIQYKTRRGSCRIEEVAFHDALDFLKHFIYNIKEEFKVEEKQKRRILNVSEANVEDTIKLENKVVRNENLDLKAEIEKLQKELSQAKLDFERRTNDFHSLSDDFQAQKKELIEYKETDYKSKFEKEVKLRKEEAEKASEAYSSIHSRCQYYDKEIREYRTKYENTKTRLKESIVFGVISLVAIAMLVFKLISA